MIIVVVVCASLFAHTNPTAFFIGANEIWWLRWLINPTTGIPIITRPFFNAFLIDWIKLTKRPIAELLTIPIQTTVCRTISPVYTIVSSNSRFLFLKIKINGFLPGTWTCAIFRMAPVFFFGLIAFPVDFVINNSNHGKV